MSKHIFCACAIFSFIALTSCGSGASSVSINTPTPPTAPVQRTYSEILDAAKSEYKKDPSFQTCMSNASTMCVNSVIQNRATKEKQESYCSDIADPSYRDSCLFGVISEKARETMDISLCDKLQSQQKLYCKQQMVTTLAFSKKDPAECDKLASSPVSGEASQTAEVRSMIDNCRLSVIINVATKRNDTALCQSIENTMMKSSCIQSIESRFVAPAPVVSTGSNTPTRNRR